MRLKVLIVFGTRPEAIKMSPLVKQFSKYEKEIETRVCVTAQHREMLDQVLEIFEISPNYDLDLMRKDQNLYNLTSEILIKIKPVLDDYNPDYVFVHGDTTTTFATSLAAYYKKIPVCHIEAGLRTGDIYSPWPEEANRKLTTQLSAWHFSPTQMSKLNLIRENIPDNKIIVTGNTVIDALLWVRQKIKNNSQIKKNIEMQLNFPFDLESSKYLLITGHRRENFGSGFINICQAIRQIALNRKDIKIVYPVHLNPNVKKPVSELLSGIENVHLIDPVNYIEFVYLMENSYLIITDSGGVQEEAPSLNKPVLVMREKTERPEALDSKSIKLVGTDKFKIISQVNLLLDNENAYKDMQNSLNPYGDGNACEKIVNHFLV